MALAYRESFLQVYQPPGGLGESVHEYLTGVVLPRLAADGWIESTAASSWAAVQATGAWWQDAVADRESTVALLLAAAERTAAAAYGSVAVRPGSLLEGRDLTKSFRGRRVVNDVTVQLKQGEIVGLLGPNGAGKTTTFYLLTGLIRPEAGRVMLDGRDLTKDPMFRRARTGIGYLAQEPSVFRRMTVEENILAILETRKLPRAERHQQLERMLDELGIRHLRNVKAYALSGGERRRLEITRALVSEPKFMLLDEPFAGVDPIAVHDIQTIVAGLRHRGIGVLITDHNVEQTLDIVDRAYIMFEGKVQAAGTVRELVYDDRVAQLYLGPTLTGRLRARLENVA
jgi:lipopolysaccharide export system ATP-binding protein